MTGAVVLAALVGLGSLLAGVGLGWYLRRTNDWCAHCGEQLSCDACGTRAGWPRPGPGPDAAADPAKGGFSSTENAAYTSAEMLKLSRNTLPGS